jgi:hypothetical protein
MAYSNITALQLDHGQINHFNLIKRPSPIREILTSIFSRCDLSKWFFSERDIKRFALVFYWKEKKKQSLEIKQKKDNSDGAQTTRSNPDTTLEITKKSPKNKEKATTETKLLKNYPRLLRKKDRLWPSNLLLSWRFGTTLCLWWSQKTLLPLPWSYAEKFCYVPFKMIFKV